MYPLPPDRTHTFLNRFCADSRYWVDVLNSVGLYLVLALSLNIILSYAGMFNMGSLDRKSVV